MYPIYYRCLPDEVLLSRPRMRRSFYENDLGSDKQRQTEGGLSKGA
jgi:hypothetical protein